MKKVFIALAIASFVVSLSHTASYSQEQSSQEFQGHPRFKHNRMGKGQWKNNKAEFKKHHEKLKKELNLTPEQEEKAKALKKQSRENLMPFIEEMKAQREKMRSLRTSNATPEQIRAEKEKMEAIKAQIRNIHEKNLSSFESILTPDQKVKFEDLKEQRREMMKNRKRQMRQYHNHHPRK